MSAAAAGLGLQPVRAAEEARAAGVPQKYTLDYAQATEFCAPVTTFFDEVERSFEVVRGRKFTHKPNGGYGLAEPGCTLLEVTGAGRRASVKLVSVSEDEIEIEMSPDSPGLREIRGFGQADRRYPVTVHDGKSFVSARLLWEIRSRPGFYVAGNSLSTEGWLDPVAALRQLGADRRACALAR